MPVVWGLDQQLYISGHLLDVSVIHVFPAAPATMSLGLRTKRQEASVWPGDSSHKPACFYQGGKSFARSLSMRLALTVILTGTRSYGHGTRKMNT